MSLLDSHGDALTHNDEVIRVDDIPLNGCTFDQINITTGYLIVSQRKPTELENLFIGAHDQASAAKASVPGAIKLATA